MRYPKGPSDSGQIENMEFKLFLGLEAIAGQKV
jgi:hypothetical protein